MEEAISLGQVADGYYIRQPLEITVDQDQRLPTVMELMAAGRAFTGSDGFDGGNTAAGSSTTCSVLLLPV